MWTHKSWNTISYKKVIIVSQKKKKSYYFKHKWQNKTNEVVIHLIINEALGLDLGPNPHLGF